jgi:putative zinc finger protein
VTCHDAREWLGALVDGAIDPARRAEVETHVLACAECRLELEGLRATVGLLRRVEPARAPAGFVDRVMERAHPAPWYRRVAAWLFVPLSVKLPAEAAAIVAIAGLAMLVIDRTPELRDAARVERQAAPPIAPAPSPPLVRTPPERKIRETPGEQIAAPPPPSRAEASRAPSEKAPPAPPVARGEEARGASSEQGAPAPVPASPPEPTPAPGAAAAPPPRSPVTAQQPQSTVTAPSPRPLVTAPPPQSAATAPPPRPPAAAESPDEKRERSQMARKFSSPSAGRVAGLSARPVDVAGRLEVRDRSVAVAALPELLSKVGGSETARRQDGTDVVIEVLIPEARYDDFVLNLEALGVWSAPGLRQRVMLDAPYLRIPIRIAE